MQNYDLFKQLKAKQKRAVFENMSLPACYTRGRLLIGEYGTCIRPIHNIDIITCFSLKIYTVLRLPLRVPNSKKI